MTHICVGKLTIIGSDNGLSPDWRQAIIWTNAGILLIKPLGTNFSEILIEILTFSFKKMRLKVSSAKRRPSCLGLNVLKSQSLDTDVPWLVLYIMATSFWEKNELATWNNTIIPYRYRVMIALEMQHAGHVKVGPIPCLLVSRRLVSQSSRDTDRIYRQMPRFLEGGCQNIYTWSKLRSCTKTYISLKNNSAGKMLANLQSTIIINKLWSRDWCVQPRWPLPEL